MRRTSCYLLPFLINFLLAVSHSGSCTPSAAASLGFLFTWNALPELLPQFWLVATLQAPPSAVPLVSVQGLWHSKLWHTQHAVLCNNNDTPYSYCLLCLIANIASPSLCKTLTGPSATPSSYCQLLVLTPWGTTQRPPWTFCLLPPAALAKP